MDQLKKLWDNTKTEYKRGFTKQKQAALQTGGGVIESTFQEDADMEGVMDTLDIELRYAYDSDTILMSRPPTNVQPKPASQLHPQPSTSAQPKSASQLHPRPSTSAQTKPASQLHPRPSPSAPQRPPSEIEEEQRDNDTTHYDLHLPVIELCDVVDNIEYEEVRNLENWVVSSTIIIQHLTRVTFICSIKRLMVEEMEGASSTPNHSVGINAPSSDGPSTSRGPPMVEGVTNGSLPSPIPCTTRYRARNKKDLALEHLCELKERHMTNENILRTQLLQKKLAAMDAKKEAAIAKKEAAIAKKLYYEEKLKNLSL